MKRYLKEDLIVSPSGEVTNYNNLPDSASDYIDVPHYEVDYTNTGYDDEGVLYIDPTIDGGKITITKVDEEGNRTNYILDLTGSVPSLYTAVNESRKRLNKRSFKESRLLKEDTFNKAKVEDLVKNGLENDDFSDIDIRDYCTDIIEGDWSERVDGDVDDAIEYAVRYFNRLTKNGKKLPKNHFGEAISDVSGSAGDVIKQHQYEFEAIVNSRKPEIQKKQDMLDLLNDIADEVTVDPKYFKFKVIPIASKKRTAKDMFIYLYNMNLAGGTYNGSSTRALR